MGVRDDPRMPAVAGSFYAGSASSLRTQLEQCFLHSLGPGSLPAQEQSPNPVLGLLSPHAGYIYSGPIAAHGYRRLAVAQPQTAVIIGPNHRGMGAAIAVSAVRAWQTPLGEIAIDRGISDAIISQCPWARPDNLAHAMEHSVEVQVPFLQFVFGDAFSLVAIVMSRQDWPSSRSLGDAIGKALGTRPAVIIASSDLTHYEPQLVAAERDALALEAILSLEPQRLATVVSQHSLTMCGPGPVMAMLQACRQLGATKAELLRYATSGDAAGDYSRVVGYASALFAQASPDRAVTR